MSELVGVITRANPRARPLPRCPVRRRRTRGTAGRMRGARPVPALERQPLRAGARAVLPVRHPPFSYPARHWARGARASIPFAGYTNLLKRRFEEAIDTFSRRRRPPDRAPPCRAPWPPPTTRWAFRRSPTRCAAACAPCAAISGCSAPAIRPTTRCGSARTARPAGRRTALPDPARSHARPHGPDPQRLERHLLPRDGFSRGRAGAQHLHRPRRARRRSGGAAASGGGVFPRHRRAGAAADQRGPGGHGRDQHSPKCSISRATTWAC